MFCRLREVCLSLTSICHTARAEAVWAPTTSALARVQAVKKEVDASVEQAKKGTIPSVDVLYKNIYRAPLGSVARGIDAKSIHKVG